MIATVWAMNLVEMHETFAELDLEISHHPQNVRAERTPEREKINRNLWRCAGDGRMIARQPRRRRGGCQPACECNTTCHGGNIDRNIVGVCCWGRHDAVVAGRVRSGPSGSET